MAKKPELVQRVDFIKKVCEGKKVLHLGCTNYPYTKEALDNGILLHFELERVAAELSGFDFDRTGLDLLENAGGRNLFQADLEKLPEVQLEETFEVIIAGEIIEHLRNPGLFLEGIKRFMDGRTDLVITTVNAFCALRFMLYGLRGRGGLNEPVHPDHVAYYSYKTLGLAVEKAELAVREFYFYDLGSEHRPFNPFYYNWFNDISVKLSRQLADGVIAVCGLAQEKTDG